MSVADARLASAPAEKEPSRHSLLFLGSGSSADHVRPRSFASPPSDGFALFRATLFTTIQYKNLSPLDKTRLTWSFIYSFTGETSLQITWKTIAARCAESRCQRRIHKALRYRTLPALDDVTRLGPSCSGDAMHIWDPQANDSSRDARAREPNGRPASRRLRRRSSPPHENLLEDREPLYRSLFDDIPIGLYITTANGTIVNANVELARMLGYPDKETLLGTNVAEVYAEPCARQQVIDALRTPGAVHRAEVSLRTRSGALIIASDVCRAVCADGTGVLYYEGSLQDITEAKRLEEQLRHMARHDPLTGVYNRHALAEILVAEAARSRRYGHPIGMLMIDVDRFKEFNDRFGHDAGDEILKAVSGLIVRCVRDSDIVVRYGGDEFLVLLVETNGQAARVKERIECEMAVQFGDSRDGAPITASIGAAHWDPQSGETISALLSRADKAMYAEKERKFPPLPA